MSKPKITDAAIAGTHSRHQICIWWVDYSFSLNFAVYNVWRSFKLRFGNLPFDRGFIFQDTEGATILFYVLKIRANLFNVLLGVISLIVLVPVGRLSNTPSGSWTLLLVGLTCTMVDVSSTWLTFGELIVTTVEDSTSSIWITAIWRHIEPLRSSYNVTNPASITIQSLPNKMYACFHSPSACMQRITEPYWFRYGSALSNWVNSSFWLPRSDYQIDARP